MTSTLGCDSNGCFSNTSKIISTNSTAAQAAMSFDRNGDWRVDSGLDDVKATRWYDGDDTSSLGLDGEATARRGTS